MNTMETTAARAELWDRIENVRPAMLVTMEPDGSHRSRPMWTQGDDFDGDLWFFVGHDSATARAIARQPEVCVSYAAPDKDLYVSVSGRAEVVQDRAKANELWNTYAQAWFPGGVDDPDLALIRLTVDYAQLWEDNKPKLLQFAEIVLGAVTGKPPQSGEERKLNLGGAPASRGAPSSREA